MRIENDDTLDQLSFRYPVKLIVSIRGRVNSGGAPKGFKRRVENGRSIHWARGPVWQMSMCRRRECKMSRLIDAFRTGQLEFCENRIQGWGVGQKLCSLVVHLSESEQSIACYECNSTASETNASIREGTRLAISSGSLIPRGRRRRVPLGADGCSMSH